MFIMIAYLKCIFSRSKHKQNYTVTIGTASIATVFILLNYENISELFEGSGIEWLKICLILMSFLSFFSANISLFPPLQNSLIAIGAVSLLVIHLSSFMLYFMIYVTYSELVMELLIGCLVGIGICVSFYFLFIFTLQELWQSKFQMIVLFLWSLFVASQLSLLSNYLHQIDMVSAGHRRLFDLSSWVKDDSEYGFMLKALTGFDSAPSVFYGLVLLVGFTSMYACSLWNKQSLFGERNE